MDLASFQANRNETLTRRVRSARATGQVPLWPVSETAMDETEPEESKPAAAAPPADAPTPLGSKLALTAGVVAVLVAIVVALGMAMHRATYKY